MDGINVKDFIKLDPGLSKQLEEFTQKLKDAGQALKDGFGKGLGEEAIKKLKQEVIDSSNGLKDWTGNLDVATQEKIKFIQKQNEMAESLGFAEKISSSFMEGMENLTSQISSSAQVMGAAGSETYKGFINPLQTADLTIGGVSETMKRLDDALQNLKDAQNVARVSSILLGEGLEVANDKAKEYPTNLRESAAVTGIAADKLHEMNKILRQVPGSLSPIESGFAGITALQNQHIQASAALGVTLKAFGMTSSEAAQLGETSWFKFGQSAEQTVEQMGLMASAAEKAGVQIGRDKAAKQIEEASSGLAIFGQKAGAASEVWTTFMQNLGNTIPIDEVQKMVTQLIGNIANMSVESRAFIGMMSGVTSGQSALGGALDLELSLRPGADEATRSEGLQKHMQGLTDTLARFAGGQIITLEQAANNPQLEVQFQLQRQMLGKLANITNTEQQNRVLEVLQGVQSGGMAALDGTKALQQVYKEGSSIADQQLSVVKRIEQHLRVIMGDQADIQLEAADASLRTPGLSNIVAEEIGRKDLAFVDTPGAKALMNTLGTTLRGALPKMQSQVKAEGGEASLKKTMELASTFAKGAAGRTTELEKIAPRQPGEQDIQAKILTPRALGESTAEGATMAKEALSPLKKGALMTSNEFNDLALSMRKMNTEMQGFSIPSAQQMSAAPNMDQVNDSLKMIVDSLNETRNTEIFTPDVPNFNAEQKTTNVNNPIQARIENIQGENNTNVDVTINVNGNTSNVNVDESRIQKNIKELVNGITGWNEK